MHENRVVKFTTEERERESYTLASSLPRSLTGVPERGEVR